MKLIVKTDFYDLAAQKGRRYGEAFEADSERAAMLISAGLVKEAGSAEEERPRKAAAEKPATAKGEQAEKPKTAGSAEEEKPRKAAAEKPDPAKGGQAEKPKTAGKTAAKKPKAVKPAAKKPEAETK